MSTSLERIGFIGLGRMGYPMVMNLLRAGFQVKVYDLAQERTEALVGAGALQATSAGDAAVDSQLVISMILDDAALEAVALAPAGVLASAAPGTIYADMSTVSPMASAKVAKEAEQRGIPYFRARVSGSIKPSTEGTLTIFASGPRDAYEQSLPAFRAMGNRHYHVGAGEEAIYIKLVHSLMIGVLAASVGEAFAFGERGGADWSQMIEVVNNSALSSTVLNYKAPLLRERKYNEPQSTVDVAAKDIDLALAAAKHMNMPLPVTAMVREYFRMMQAQGNGGLDFFGIVTLFEELAGLSPEGGEVRGGAGAA